MTLETRLYTGEEALHLTIDGRWELVRGRIVRMSVGGVHSVLAVRVARAIDAYAELNDRGQVGVEIGFYTEFDPDTVRSPDVYFVSFDRCPDPLPPTFIRIPPELVVEIMSPNDRWSELHDKALEYLAAGVDHVWVVDSSRRIVRDYRDGGVVEFGEGDTLVGDGVLTGFAVSAAALFRPRQRSR